MKNYQIYSLGHRNPQGLFYDIENDYILETEHGPKGGDEINMIVKGKTMAGYTLLMVHTIREKKYFMKIFSKSHAPKFVNLYSILKIQLQFLI